MKRVSLSGSNKTIQEIWQWYRFQSSISIEAKNQIRQLKSSRNEPFPGTLDIFYGMSDDEIEEFFKEIEYVAILGLLASAEASIRLNYMRRAFGPRKNNAMKFRTLYKEKGQRARLDEDILKSWKSDRPEANGAVTDFEKVLKLRHWLAHGRYWKPKFSTEYSPEDVFDIVNELLNQIA